MASRDNTTTAYGSVHRTLHWVIALLVIPQLLLGDIMLIAGPHAVPTLTSIVHPTVGIVIGLLMLGRLYWRRQQNLPGAPKDIGLSGQTLSGFTHGAFYFLLIVNPVIGYLLSCAAGYPTILAVIPIPHPFGAAPEFERFMFWLHLLAGVSIGLLLTLHVLGALSHEFVLRDNVLRRMLGFPAMTAARAERQEQWPAHSPVPGMEREVLRPGAD
ncbi:MAG: cytochrome b [Gluconacetobacter diazotrophicus]|nr:cytochrome b [Gluconacetobacter diazotrophicus]